MLSSFDVIRFSHSFSSNSRQEARSLGFGWSMLLTTLIAENKEVREIVIIYIILIYLLEKHDPSISD